MVQQVRFLNSIFILGVLVFVQCQQIHSPAPFVNADSVAVSTRLGITKINDVPFTGVVYAFYPFTTDTLFYQSYLNGRENGVSKQFYPHHLMKEIRYFENGQKKDSCLSWWDTGKKKSAAYFENDEYEGVYKEWSKDGKLTKEMHYVKGHEEGTQRVWYDNGKIKSNYILHDGRRYGLLGTKNCRNVSARLFEK